MTVFRQILVGQWLFHRVSLTFLTIFIIAILVGIERVWGGIAGGAYTREAALKKHLAESKESRKRQEADAAEAHRVAEETRHEAEQQTRILEDQARQQRNTAEADTVKVKIFSTNIHVKFQAFESAGTVPMHSRVS